MDLPQTWSSGSLLHLLQVKCCEKRSLRLVSGCDINIYICTRSLEHQSSLLARADGWPARKHARDGEETVSGVRRRVADLSKSNGLCFPVDAFFVGWRVGGEETPLQRSLSFNSRNSSQLLYPHKDVLCNRRVLDPLE